MEATERRWERLARFGLLLSAGLLVASVALPYWQVRVVAPQYPQGLRLTAYLNRLSGDVRELDILNHYIGMKPLKDAAKTERRLAVPSVVLIAALLALAAFAPSRWAFLLALPAMLFPLAFTVDLYWWLWFYGTHLDPKAPLKLPPFVPPLLGWGKIAQFQAIAHFHWGFFLACLTALIALVSLIAQSRQRKFVAERAEATVGVLTLLLLALATGTSHARVCRVTPDSGLSFSKVLSLAQDGDTIVVEGGIHRGNFVVTRSVRLWGTKDRGQGTGNGKHPVLDGEGKGTVITLKAPRIILRGFVIRNSGDVLLREDAGVAVEAPQCLVADNRLEGVLFGVVLRHAPESVVRHNLLHGKDLPLPRRGDLIKVWYSDGAQIIGNAVVGGRDVVLWFSKRLTVRGNEVRRGRYGVHFMYCDGAEVSLNRLTDNAVGAYLMYSQRVHLRRNWLVGNRGPSGYGVGLKDMRQAVVAENVIAANRAGIFAEGAIACRFERNLIARNDVGIRLFPSSYANTLTANSFVDNGEQVVTEGAAMPAANRWQGNFWSDYAGYDADGDGFGDVPYKAEQLFERLADRQPNLRLFAFSPIAQTLDFAARCFPVFAPQPQLTDPRPRMRPVVPSVPHQGENRQTLLGLAINAVTLLLAAMLLCGDKRHPFRQNFAHASENTRLPEGETVIIADNLTKRFGALVAVNGVSFQVRRSEVVALWGPNGAGKTTILRCLLGLLSFEGTAIIGGHDVRRESKEVRRLVGSLPQDVRLHGDWTVAETLRFYARLRKVATERVEALMAEWRLDDIADKPVGSLSGGMRQRLAFALALLSDPPVLLLDEPTANLDAQTRREVWSALARLKAQGKTIVLSTHRPDEVRQLADRVLVLDKGTLVAVGHPKELASLLQERVTLKLLVPESHRLSAATLLRQHGFAVSFNEIHLLVTVPSDRKAEPIQTLALADIPVADFELGEGSGQG